MTSRFPPNLGKIATSPHNYHRRFTDLYNFEFGSGTQTRSYLALRKLKARWRGRRIWTKTYARSWNWRTKRNGANAGMTSTFDLQASSLKLRKNLTPKRCLMVKKWRNLLSALTIQNLASANLNCYFCVYCAVLVNTLLSGKLKSNRAIETNQTAGTKSRSV